MGALSEKVRERMQQQAHAAREGMQGAGRTAPVFDLTGKNAIVPAGQAFMVRLMPRWDIAQKYRLEGTQWIENPEYQDDLVYFVALEHWWDESGKPHREWCPRTFDENTPCPICEEAEDLGRSGNTEDRTIGKRMRARKTFLFNAVLGHGGKRALTEAGKPDIRVLPTGNTLFVSISGFMTGGSDDATRAAFARGDITAPADGYDLLIKRPNEGERWSADCAPAPSTMYSQAEAPSWGEWMSLLVDIPAMVEREIKSYDDLYEQYHGTPPTAAPGPQPPPGPSLAPPGAPGFASPAPGEIGRAHV